MIETNPQASALAKLVIASWPAMLARFRDEAKDGLSVPQVGRFLGARDFAARPSSESSLVPIAKTLNWLARRGYLKVAQAPKRTRFVLTDLARNSQSNSP